MVKKNQVAIRQPGEVSGAAGQPPSNLAGRWAHTPSRVPRNFLRTAPFSTLLVSSPCVSGLPIS